MLLFFLVWTGPIVWNYVLKFLVFKNINRNNVPSSKFQAKIDEAVKIFEEQLAPDGSENEVDRQARDMAKSMLLNIVCLYKHGDVWSDNVQAKIIEYRAEQTRIMKQGKAKASTEAKKKAKDGAQPRDDAQAPSSPTGNNAGQAPAGGAICLPPAGGAGGLTPMAPLSTSNVSEVNLSYYQSVQEDMRKILKRLGPDFANKDALQIAQGNQQGDGGIQEPFNKESATRALGNQNLYICAGNLFWLDFLRSPSPGVPLQRHGVCQLGDFLWPKNQSKPMFLLKLLEVEAPTDVPERPSALGMLSPEGYAHAALYAAARDLPEHKEEWQIVLRSVPFCFVAGAKNTWIHLWNCRNQLTQEYESLSRSALQQATEISMLKKRMESDVGRTLQPAELVNQLKQFGLKKASSQDDLTTNLVQLATQVYEKMKGPEMLGPILAMEEKFGTKSCFNSLSKLHLLATKPEPNRRVWVMQGIYDWLVRCLLTNDEVTKNTLTGDRNTCGLIPLLELKMLCLEHWLSSMMARANILEKDRAVIRRVLQDHASYRQEMLGSDVSW